MSERKTRGRPAYVPTDEEREKVRVLKAGGMSHEAIAEALGISHVTLSKHFSLDLEVGAAKVTAEIMMARYYSAKGGNVSAQNKLLEQLGAIPPRPRQAKGPKPGKKEAAQAEAQSAHVDSDWSQLLQ